MPVRVALDQRCAHTKEEGRSSQDFLGFFPHFFPRGAFEMTESMCFGTVVSPRGERTVT